MEELWDRLAPIVAQSLRKAQFVWMFQGQIMLVQETITSVSSELMSSLKAENDNISTHGLWITTKKTFWKLLSCIRIFWLKNCRIIWNFSPSLDCCFPLLWMYIDLFPQLS